MAAFRLAQRLPQWWYRPRLAPPLLPLLPLSWLFGLVVRLRRRLYVSGVSRTQALPVPVIVVGNLTVGGSGKTPCVLWLVQRLREHGFHPGIISRGYGGNAASPRLVGLDSAPRQVGDEPLLLARRSGVPVIVGRDRVAAGRALLAAHPDCDVLVADDGLQHYRLARDLEIVLFDARGAGNGRLLPAGPLREPLARLRGASAVVWNGMPQTLARRAAQALPQFAMRLSGERFSALDDPRRRCDAAALQGHRLYAVAGIGDPSRFFRQLEALGLDFEAHPFPDHHAYTADDLSFAGDGVLLMTEKDAVKCAPIYTGAAWVLPVEATVEPCEAGQPGLFEIILEKLDGRKAARHSGLPDLQG